MKRTKIDEQTKRIVHTGLIRIFTRREHGAYDFTQIRLTQGATEVTRESSELVNARYNDRDYRQHVGEVDTVSYDRHTIDVDFMHGSTTRENGDKTYCDPRFEFRNECDMGMLKAAFAANLASRQACGDATPDGLVADFLKRGYIIVKQEERTIKKNDGTSYAVNLDVRDHEAEAAVKARVIAQKAAIAERERVWEAESAARAAERQRERQARDQGDLSPALAD